MKRSNEKMNYEIEMIINRNLYKKGIISENMYKKVELELLKLSEMFDKN